MEPINNNAVSGDSSRVPVRPTNERDLRTVQLMDDVERELLRRCASQVFLIMHSCGYVRVQSISSGASAELDAASNHLVAALQCFLEAANS